MIYGLHTGKPPADWIESRDIHVARVMKEEGISEEDAIRRWDCEFPEYHQSLIDPLQTLFEGNEKYTHHHFDTIDRDLENCDYKQNSRNGVHLSSFVYNCLKKGITNHIIVWEWADKNRHKRLYANEEVSYIILGAVPAQQVIKNAKQVGYDYKGRPKYRFTFNEV